MSEATKRDIRRMLDWTDEDWAALEKVVRECSAADVLHALAEQSPVNTARAVLSGHCGKMEQDAAQRRPMSPIEARRQEFLAILRIQKALMT